MKKHFTLLLFSTFLVNSIFASAEFFMKINTNGNYTVTLGNQTLSTTSNVFRFFDLSTGNYQLRVTQKAGNRVLYNKTVFINDGFRFVAELDAFNGLNIIQKLPFVQQSWYLDNVQTNQSTNQPTCGTPVPPPSCPQPPKTTCNNNGGWNAYPNNNSNQGYNYNNNNYNNNGWNNGSNTTYNYYNNELTDADLQTLIQTMKGVTFEEKMIEVAKTALKNRMLKTLQVHQLLEQITFEANKLELAKFCYDKTIDKNNYYTLYNDFTFSNYSTQLDKYINSR